jgi:hypothetical protein
MALAAITSGQSVNCTLGKWGCGYSTLKAGICNT